MARYTDDKDTNRVGQLTTFATPVIGSDSSDVLLCDGSWYPRTSYPVLAAALGDAWIAEGNLVSNYQATSGTNNAFLGINLSGMTGITSGIHSQIATSSTTFARILPGSTAGSSTYSHTWVTTSTDGAKWRFDGFFEGSPWAIRYVNSAFFICTTAGVWRSTDEGVTWTKVFEGTAYDIAYGASVYVVQSASTTYYSSNLTTWTKSSATHAGYSLGFIGARFVSVTNSGSTYYYSTDGISWSSSTHPLTNGVNTFVANGYLFVGRSSGTIAGFAYTSDGSSWFSSSDSRSTGYLTSVAYDGVAYLMTFHGASSTDPGFYRYTTLNGAGTLVTYGTTSATYAGAVAFTNSRFAFFPGHGSSNAQGSGVVISDSTTPTSAITEWAASSYLTPYGGNQSCWGESNGRVYMTMQLTNQAAAAYAVGIVTQDANRYFVTARNSGQMDLDSVWGQGSPSYATHMAAYYDATLDKFNCVSQSHNGTNYGASSAVVSGTTFTSTANYTAINNNADKRIFANQKRVGFYQPVGLGGPYTAPMGGALAQTNTGYGTTFTTQYLNYFGTDGVLVSTGLHSTTVYEMKVSFDGGGSWVTRNVASDVFFTNAGSSVTVNSTFNVWRLGNVWYGTFGSTLYMGDSPFKLVAINTPTTMAGVFNNASTNIWEQDDGTAILVNSTNSGRLLRGYAPGVIYDTMLRTGADTSTAFASKVTVCDVDSLASHAATSGTITNNVYLFNYPYNRDNYFRMPVIPSTTGSSLVGMIAK